jgi:hypothetical protein
MSTPSQKRTKRQLEALNRLPEDRRVVGARRGAPIVPRHDGHVLRVQPNGRLARKALVEHVSHYLKVRGG